jgi:membrane protein
LITHALVKNFCDGEKPWDAEQISHSLEIPIRLVRQLLFELVESEILSEVKKEDEKDIAYQPAIDVGKLSVKYIVEALDKRGTSDLPMEQTNELKKISECLKAFAGDLEKSPANILLRDI